MCVYVLLCEDIEYSTDLHVHVWRNSIHVHVHEEIDVLFIHVGQHICCRLHRTRM